MATRSKDTAAFTSAGGESLSHRELAAVAAELFTGVDNLD
nr:hypothetical protein GCM10023233_25010 [Brevibacterium otitidis]